MFSGSILVCGLILVCVLFGGLFDVVLDLTFALMVELLTLLCCDLWLVCCLEGFDLSFLL